MVCQKVSQGYTKAYINHKSDEGALVPVRKGREEVGVSKRQTEVLVNTA